MGGKEWENSTYISYGARHTPLVNLINIWAYAIGKWEYTLIPNIHTLYLTVAEKYELRDARVPSYNALNQPVSSVWTYASCSAFWIKDQQCEYTFEGAFHL